MRLIQKYPNRRLYDTVESRYITLEDVRSLVLRGIEFEVKDRRSQENISRATLLQVLTEGEEAAGSKAVLTRSFLLQAIRAQSSSGWDGATAPVANLDGFDAEARVPSLAAG